MTMATDVTPDLTAPSAELLAAVERRVLWIATSIVHHANKVRAEHRRA